MGIALLVNDFVSSAEIDLAAYKRAKRASKNDGGQDLKFSEVTGGREVWKNNCGLQMEMVHSTHDMAYLVCTWKKGKHPRWRSPEIPAHAARVISLMDLGQTILSFPWDALPAQEYQIKQTLCTFLFIGPRSDHSL